MSDTYKEIFERNKRWVAEKLAVDPHYFQRMSMNQSPEYLFIGCSDSRADPQEITGLKAGQAFVHRNVANIVNPIDQNVASVVQYAIENLNVKHIIVCGHYGCGGIQAAMDKEGLGKSGPWLEVIRDIYRIHLDDLSAIADKQERYRRLVEVNVIEQSLNVIKMECVQRRFYRMEYPIVHSWVFDMETGLIIDLNIDFKAALASVQET